MPFEAKHRFARIAPRKARLLMDLIRGRDVDDAITLLRDDHRLSHHVDFIAEQFRLFLGQFS